MIPARLRFGQAIVAVLTAALVLAGPAAAVAFTGPASGQAAGTGSGAIGVGANQNISVGTSTTQTSTKLLVIASSTGDAGNYALKVLDASLNPLLIVRNDGSIGIGTATFTNTGIGALTVGGLLSSSQGFTGSLSAGNVSAGEFGSNTGGGVYSFPNGITILQPSAGIPLLIDGQGEGVDIALRNGNAPAPIQWCTTSDCSYIAQLSNGNLYLGSDIAGGANDLTVTQSGNVGIGTTSPGYPLEIYSMSNTVIGLQSGSGSGHSYTLGSNTNGDFSLYDQTANADRLHITASGNVGIGTATPMNGGWGGTLSLLDVTNASGGGVVQVRDTNGTYGGIQEGGGQFYVGTVGTGGTAPVNIVAGNGNVRMTILGTNGNVGIGTIAPTQKLEVSGNAQIDGGLYAGNWIPTAYSNWGADGGPGAGGAAIYNDDGTYKELMIVGNNSAGLSGGWREVGLWDDLTVDHNLTVQNNLTVDGTFGGGAMTGTLNAGNVSAGTFGSNTGGGNYAFPAAAVFTTTGIGDIDINSAGSYWGNISNPGTQVWALGYSTGGTAVGTPVLSWNASGNVGIDTTAPIRPLTITESGNAGELAFVSASGTASTGYIDVSDVNGNNPGSFTIRGLTSSGGAGANLSAITLAANTVNTPTAINIGATNSTNVNIDANQIWALNNGSPSDLYLNYNSAAGNTIIQQLGGDVGIGQGSPSYTLDVSGDERVASGDNSFTYYGPNASWGGSLYVGATTVKETTATAQVIATNGNLHLDSGSASSLYLQYYSGQNTYINAAGGEVGIGTVAPIQKLEVNGNILTENNVMLNGVAGNAICFWSDCSNYTIAMGSGAYYDYGPVTDYSIRNTMSNTAGRGWVWGANGVNPIAALNTSGNMEIAGNFTLAAANPTLYTGGSYLTIPYGLYVSGGTTYISGVLNARGGLYDDNASYLTIGGGTAGVTDFTGSVGIGTTSPGNLLTLQKLSTTTVPNGSEAFLGITNTADGQQGLYGIGFYSNGGILQAGIDADNLTSGGADADLVFYTRNSSGVYGESMRITSSGNLTVGNGSGKITYGTLDPVYDIGGTEYATYGAGITGEKEETAGTVTLAKNGNAFSYTFDFSDVTQGSDLWLFSSVTNFGTDYNDLTVLLTAGFDGNVWYAKDAAAQTLTIYGSAAGQVSYRLTAPRFDAAKWTNLSTDPSVQGITVPEK